MRHNISWRMIVCLFSGLLSLAGCVTSPVTGRSQLQLIPAGMLNQLAVEQYQQVISETKKSENTEQVTLVAHVGERLVQATNQYIEEIGESTEDYQWEFTVIQDDETVNAWCMPGGKVAVYTGILPLTQDDAGLAVVMGHEFAHALANHGNERMSQALLVQLGGVALSVALEKQPDQTRDLFLQSYGAIGQVGFLLPFSRKHEYEADRIGLDLMARAGYDPRAAVPFWERMRDKGGGKRPPVFLSTHPVAEDRIAAIQQHMPEALALYESSPFGK